MKEFEHVYFKKMLKRQKNLIIISIIFCLFGIAFILMGIDSNEKILDFKQILSENSTKEEQLAYLDIKIITDDFAGYDDEDDAFYFASDGKYLYIVYLDKYVYEDIVNTTKNNKTYRVKGYTDKIDNDLKDIAIKEWNLVETENKLTNENFYSIFGNLYLDQTVPNDRDFNYLLAGIFLIIGFILLVIYVFYKSKNKKTMYKIDDEEFNKLNIEINDPSSKYYKRNRLLLTKNYIITFNGIFNYFKYTDILWMWDFKQYYNFINTGTYLKVFTKDAKEIQIMSCGRVKTQEQEYNEVLNTIKEHNKNIRIGFTPENIKYSVDYKKELKSKIIDK